LLWIVLGVSGLLACGGGDDDEPGFCERFCQRATACNGANGSSCLVSCGDFEATSPVSGVLLDEMATCVARSSCSSIQNDEYFAACWDEAIVRVEPSAGLVDKCTEISTNDFSCGLDADVGRCVDNLKAYKAQFVEDVLDCSRLSCAESVACYMELSE
jgi:hypothetical protein